MLSALSLLLLVGTVYAREVEHYIAVCGDGDILPACTQPFCDSGTAYPKAQEVCSNRGGVSELVTLTGKRGSQEALISEVEQKVALQQKKEREERLAKAKEEERRQEAARKEREKRREEEARKLAEAQEKEAQNCRAQRTYAPTVWACPHGDYVADPNECSQLLEGTTRSGDHAIQVDLGYRILPPGVSCPLMAGKAEINHEGMYEFLLGWANFGYNGEERPEGFDFDVAAPVNQSFASWRKAEDRRLASIPYDCLAGVCLNAPATRIPDKLVTVSEVVVYRTVEVCSGRVVEVHVFEGYDGFADALTQRVQSELEALGWSAYDDQKKDETFSFWYRSPQKRGVRQVRFGRDWNGEPWFSLSSTHPDKDALCAPKRQQGL